MLEPLTAAASAQSAQYGLAGSGSGAFTAVATPAVLLLANAMLILSTIQRLQAILARVRENEESRPCHSHALPHAPRPRQPGQYRRWEIHRIEGFLDPEGAEVGVDLTAVVLERKPKVIADCQRVEERRVLEHVADPSPELLQLPVRRSRDGDTIDAGHRGEVTSGWSRERAALDLEAPLDQAGREHVCG